LGKSQQRNPAGHSFGPAEPKPSIDQEQDWHECLPYLWGIDLFNNGYYWEAHETWEAVWHATGHRGTMADFCKALTGSSVIQAPSSTRGMRRSSW
jgi:hypothetical protein